MDTLRFNLSVGVSPDKACHIQYHSKKKFFKFQVKVKLQRRASGLDVSVSKFFPIEKQSISTNFVTNSNGNGMIRYD